MSYALDIGAMRRFLAPLAPVFLSLLATFACSDDDSSGAPVIDGGSLDVVVPPGNDLDTGTPDSGLNVSVQITGGTRADIGVVFEYADGSFESTKTDASGHATSTKGTPAKATALLRADDRPTPITWIEPAAGDVLAARGHGDDPAPVGSIVVTFPTPTTSPRVFAEASANCHAPIEATTATVSVLGLCVQADGKASILARQSDPLGVATGFAVQKDVPTNAPLTLAEWKAGVDFTLTATTFPADVSVGGAVTELFKELGYDAVTDTTLTAVAPSQVFKVADGFADAYQAHVVVSNGTTFRLQLQRGTAKSATFDLSTLAAALTAPTVTGDPQRPTLGWTGDTTKTTGGAVQIFYPTANDVSGTWTLVLPAGRNQVDLPALPADAAAFAPRAGLTIDAYSSNGMEVAFATTPSAITPALFRTRLAALVDIGDVGPLEVLRTSPVPVTGTVNVTGIAFAQH